MIAPIHSKDYSREWELLEETLEQALQVEDTVAVVIVDKLLPSKFQTNPRVKFIQSLRAIPSHVRHYRIRAKDKTRKRILGLNAQDAQYYMMLDADDYVPLTIVSWLKKHKPVNGIYMPNVNLITNTKTYFISNDKPLFHPDHKTLCGSSIVYSAKALKVLMRILPLEDTLSTHNVSPVHAKKYGVPLVECTTLTPGYRSTGHNISDEEFGAVTLLEEVGIKAKTGKPLKALGNYYFKAPDMSWALTEVTRKWITDNIPKGARILEFGSGNGSKLLASRYDLTSIEHDPMWLNKHDGQYIHAPIVDGWYDVDVLDNALTGKWDLIIIDGPPGHIGRNDIVSYFELLGLNTGCPVMIDDTDRPDDMKTFEGLREYFDHVVVIESDNKSTHILHN
jgi:hypothetical protein